MTPIERVKLTKQLMEVHAALEGEKSPIQRVRLARQKLEIRAKLQAERAPVSATEPQNPQPVALPEPQQGQQEAAQELLAIIQGQHDGEGLQALYERIKRLVEGLDKMQALSGIALTAANDAITHWAELEVKVNG